MKLGIFLFSFVFWAIIDIIAFKKLISKTRYVDTFVKLAKQNGCFTKAFILGCEQFFAPLSSYDHNGHSHYHHDGDYEIEYGYIVNGVHYRTKRWSIISQDSDRIIYYDPANPKKAFFENDQKHGSDGFKYKFWKFVFAFSIVGFPLTAGLLLNLLNQI